MDSITRLHVVKGGREELGRQLLRAMIEFRSDDVRAIADRIARRGSLNIVGGRGEQHPHRTATDAAYIPDADKPHSG